VIPRKNSISRKAPGREGKIMHTIAANLDYVVITTSLHEPDFSPGLVDRFLISTSAAGIIPLIVINKMDLRSGEESPWKLYSDLGYQCFPVSTREKSGINELRNALRGKTSVFCGHSGVGKTSLLSELFGEVVGKVGVVSGATGKGKHTTTVSKMIPAGEGTRFIDTPGIKEFGLIGVDPKTLIQYFPEMYELQVKRQEYSHLPRFESYLRIKAALEDEGR
jgi:ribosome biogenesis GTPase